MRTTVSIDDHVLQAAKRRAAERGTTLGNVIEEALRAALLRPADAPGSSPFRLVTFRGSGPRPGVDLDRTSDLLELDDLERYGLTGRR